MIGTDPTEATVFPDPQDAERFLYVPGDPTPELGPNGAPSLTLLMAGAHSRLQLGARWTVDEATLDRLRRRLLTQHPELNSARLSLQPAPARVREVTLLLKGRELAHSSSSGFLPYAAVFAIPLITEEDRAAALRAVHGTEGELTVRYTADVQGKDGCWQTVTREGDVGRWFRGRSADGHLLFAPGADTPPVSPTPDLPTAVTFHVGARARDMPLAFVTLAWGAETATLGPPDFGPASLGTSKGPVEVTTRYTTGGKPYTTCLIPDGDTHDLTPADLGLCEVVLDAEGWHERDVREVRAHVIYRAAEGGTDDERTVHLRGETWTTRWWLVTRPSLDSSTSDPSTPGTPTLAGTLEVSLKITLPDGQTLMPPRFRATDPHLTLTPPPAEDGETQEAPHDSD
ncbi:hypothetical protein V3W47_03630 [Deinococcus sp. YIM 134068]|uniref:hypothetical protein n=1 Tax=Deinococcus lichenicola TaxID=3118910 RepID=UPI002F955602